MSLVSTRSGPTAKVSEVGGRVVRRPEVDLLLCCARTSRTPEITGRIEALLRKNIDWEYLLRMAYAHGLAPLLYWQLNDACSEAVPKDVLDRLRDHFQANHLRSLFLTGELHKLLNKLELSGIPAVPYKGPALAALAYGNLAFREFGDLDILVHKRDALEAGELLTSLGYRPEYSMTRAQRAAFLRYERQYLFMRGDGSAVEIHWTVTPRAISFLLDPEHLWERTGRVSLGGGTVLTFSTEDLLLTLCAHGSAHRWERMTWICDIAELVRVSGDAVNWARLLERASATNSRRMLLLGLFLASDLLDANLPEDILHEARDEAVVKRLADKVYEQLFTEEANSEETLEETVRWRFHLQMMERMRDKFRYCIHNATSPTLLDWELMPLPVALFPFYRLLRPIRLSGSSGRRLVGRLL